MIELILGWFAAGLVLLTFYLQTIPSLRLVAIFSNLAFIGYAILIGATPILVLHSLLLPLNFFRLFQLLRQKRISQQTALNPTILGSLLLHMQTTWKCNGEYLFHQDEQANEIFLILNGEVKLVGANALLGPNQFLGVISHFKQKATREDSAVCTSDVQVATITREKLRQAIRQNPAISEMLLCTVADSWPDEIVHRTTPRHWNPSAAGL